MPLSKNRDLYFIMDESKGAVKIGLAVSPLARLRELQTGNPTPLKLMRVWADSTATDERWFHWYLAKHKINGEWFKYYDEDEGAFLEMPVLVRRCDGRMMVLGRPAVRPIGRYN